MESTAFPRLSFGRFQSLLSAQPLLLLFLASFTLALTTAHLVHLPFPVMIHLHFEFAFCVILNIFIMFVVRLVRWFTDLCFPCAFSFFQ